VQYEFRTVSTDMKWSGQDFNIVSIGTSSTPLANLKIRYWFTADGQTLATPPTCNTFPAGCPAVTLNLVAVSPPRTKADTYLEVGFTSGAGTLAAGGSSGTVWTAFHGVNWGVFTFSNDYSANSATTSLKDAPAVTLYDQNGNLVWGTEPPACAAGAACP